MRKILSAVLAAVLFISFSLTAFAAASEQTLDSTNKSGDVVISAKASRPDYEVSIPADSVIPWEASSTAIGEVKAVKMLIEPRKTVRVSVTSENSFNLVNSEDSSKKIAYTLEGAENIAFLPGDIGKGFPISVNIDAEQWAAAAAGEHRDVLTFVIEYTDA